MYTLEFTSKTNKGITLKFKSINEVKIWVEGSKELLANQRFIIEKTN